MFKIYLPKSVTDPMEVCAYSEIYRQQKNQLQYYSAKCIAYELGLKANRDTTLMKEAIRRLINGGVIIGKEEDGLFLIDNSTFDMRKRGFLFTTIYYEDIAKMLSCGFRYKMPLINYYVVMTGTLSNKNKVGSYGINKLAEICDVTPQTIYHYNKTLEDLEIMYIVHNSMNNGDTNMYGHYSNMKRICGAVKERNPKQPINPKSRANWRRSVSARYNHYISVPAEQRVFDEELYNDVLLFNSDMDELQSRQPGDDYSRRKKDMSVFT